MPAVPLGLSESPEGVAAGAGAGDPSRPSSSLPDRPRDNGAPPDGTRDVGGAVSPLPSLAA